MATSNSTHVEEPPAVAWWPVGSAMVAAVLALAATANRYGYHRDELYFLMLKPAWGYVDQPPLTPLIARGASALFGNTPTGMRIPAIVCIAVAIALMALTTRELGGGPAAQAISAWGFAFGALPMIIGHLMVTSTVDFALWAAVLLCVTRALRRPAPRWWLAAGALVGLALYNKLLIVLLLISLAVGLLAVGPRRVLRSGWLWAGVGLAVVIGSPNLIYQATHHFPQLAMAGALSDDGVRATLVPFELILIGPPLVPVCVAGFVALMRRPRWRALRAIAIAYLVSVVLSIIGGGQVYYPFGLLAYLLAAGAVPTADWTMARLRPAVGEAGPGVVGVRRGRAGLVIAAVAVNAVVTAFLALPLLPVTVVGHTPVTAINPVVGDEIGWPVYVDTFATAFAALPADQRAHAVLFTSNYGEAGALTRYGPQYHLPPVYSGQNELYFAARPPDSATTVVAWTEDYPGLSAVFVDCRRLAVMDNGVDVDNEEQDSVVAVCTVPPGGWAAIWPELQHYD